jgi:hypothetical protein
MEMDVKLRSRFVWLTVGKTGACEHGTEYRGATLMAGIVLGC